MRSYLVALSLVFVYLFALVPPVAAQTAATEDFEDDTVGQNPSGFYSFSKVLPTGATAQVAGSGLDGTSKSFRVVKDSTQQSQKLEVAFTLGFNSYQPTSSEFWLQVDAGGVPANNAYIVFAGTGGASIQYRYQSDGFIIANDGSGCGADSSTTIGTPNVAKKHRVDFDWNAKTWDLFIDDVLELNDVAFCTGAPTDFSVLRFCSSGSPTCAVGGGNANSKFFFDQWTLSGPAFPSPPEPPSGLSAVVVDAKSSSDPVEEGQVQLRWPVSSNDPDQEQGDFEYRVFLNGIDIGADATTGADGDGTRFNTVVIGGNQIGSPTSFSIKAKDLATGVTSVFSCSVNVDTSILGARDQCGTGAPAGGSGLDFTTPTDTAAGLAGFCTDLMGDSEASKFLCGLILVVIVFLGIGAAFAAMAGAPGMPAVIAGSVGGFGMMIFLVVAQIWSLGAAAVIILLATGVALALMRRLFFGGGGGG